jgi:hypothetical protein
MGVASVELFHRIPDAASARARRCVTELALEQQVRFRNLAYAEVEHDFELRGGKVAPALWVDGHLIQGVEAVLERLRALAGAS